MKQRSKLSKTVAYCQDSSKLSRQEDRKGSDGVRKVSDVVKKLSDGVRNMSYVVRKV